MPRNPKSPKNSKKRKSPTNNKRKKRKPFQKKGLKNDFYKDKQVLKKRKLLEQAAPGRGVTEEDRKLVFKFYGYACLACGRKKPLCLDHVKALYKGGRHDPDNLQPLCWPCNKKKGLKTVDYRKKRFPY